MDIYQRQGLPPYGGNLPEVPGAEGAGTVAAVGPDVRGVAVGDRVARTAVPGSHAERALIPADRAVAIPDGIDIQVAAAVMLQGATATTSASTPFRSPRATWWWWWWWWWWW
jgi:NADPH:quinone reductase